MKPSPPSATITSASASGEIAIAARPGRRGPRWPRDGRWRRRRGEGRHGPGVRPRGGPALVKPPATAWRKALAGDLRRERTKGAGRAPGAFGAAAGQAVVAARAPARAWSGRRCGRGRPPRRPAPAARAGRRLDHRAVHVLDVEAAELGQRGLEQRQLVLLQHPQQVAGPQLAGGVRACRSHQLHLVAASTGRCRRRAVGAPSRASARLASAASSAATSTSKRVDDRRAQRLADPEVERCRPARCVSRGWRASGERSAAMLLAQSTSRAIAGSGETSARVVAGQRGQHRRLGLARAIALDHGGRQVRTLRHLDLVLQRRLDQQADQVLVLQQRTGGDDRPGDLDVVAGQGLDQPRRRPVGAGQPLGQPRADVALGLADQGQEDAPRPRPSAPRGHGGAATRRARRGAPCRRSRSRGSRLRASSSNGSAATSVVTRAVPSSLSVPSDSQRLGGLTVENKLRCSREGAVAASP